MFVYMSVYLALYNTSAAGVKAVDPSLQVGGPATEHLNTQNFLSQARRRHQKLRLLLP